MHVERVLSICVLFLFVITAGALTRNNEYKIKKYYVDIRRNLTLICPLRGSDFMWIREGRDEEHEVPKLTVLDDGSLFLSDVEKNDSGVYSCTANDSDTEDDSIAKMEVFVRTPPPPLINVHVHASTILAVILWGVSGDGGYPISYFTAQFKQTDVEEEWMDITPIHIMPSSRQIDVYKLLPNTTYAFRVWATNQLGDSDISVVYQTTRISNETAELVRHFLEGAKDFDTRVWVLAVVIVMGTLLVLGLGTCFLLYQECKVPGGK